MASILCFGDSITQGFVDPEGGWTQRLRRRLDLDATVPLGEAYQSPIRDDTRGYRGELNKEIPHRLI